MSQKSAANGHFSRASKKFAVSPSNPLLLTWFPPILRDLYARSESTRHLLDPILQQLTEAWDHLTLTVGTGTCPYCSSPTQLQVLTPYRTQYKPVITWGGMKLQIQIHGVGHRCSGGSIWGDPASRSDSWEANEFGHYGKQFTSGTASPTQKSGGRWVLKLSGGCRSRLTRGTVRTRPST